MNNMNKFLLIVVILAVVIAGIWLLSPKAPQPLAEDSTQMIAKDLDGIDLNEINADLQGLEADLTNL